MQCDASDAKYSIKSVRNFFPGTPSRCTLNYGKSYEKIVPKKRSRKIPSKCPECPETYGSEIAPPFLVLLII